jgi:hypothetical protein
LTGDLEKMLKSNFIINRITPEVVELEDIGPWDQYRTITNDAEAVVAYLHQKQILTPEKQIIYTDSDGEWTEIYHDGVGNFEGFGFTQPD